MECQHDLEGAGPFGLPQQAPLSLRWEDRGFFSPILKGYPIPEKFAKTGASAAWSLYSEAIGRGRWTSYSRTGTHYSKTPRRYRSRLYTLGLVPPAFDHLAEFGLIEHDRAWKGRRGWQSAAIASQKLMDIGDTIVAAKGAPKLTRLNQPVILRGPNGELLDFKPNDETVRMHRDLEAMNEAIGAADISGCQAAPLARIFNTTGPTRVANLWDRCGRAYAMGGGWQSLPKEMRLQLQIDGEPVVEIDYDALHPSFLYEEAGLLKPGECYELGNWPRGLVKFGLLVLINADRGSTEGAIAHNPVMAEFLLAANLPTNDAHTFPAAARLIRDIEMKHAPIAGAFNTDAGARLMRKDSDIANSVMLDMIGKGVLVLPVHDSFLVAASKADLLEEAMVKAAQKYGLREPKVKRSDRRG